MKIKLNNLNDKQVNVQDFKNIQFVLIIKSTRCNNFPNLFLD